MAVTLLLNWRRNTFPIFECDIFFCLLAPPIIGVKSLLWLTSITMNLVHGRTSSAHA